MTFARLKILLLIAIVVAPFLSASVCFASRIPKADPPTAYGLNLVRPEHRQPALDVRLPLLQEAPGSLDAARLAVLNIESQQGPYSEKLIPNLIAVSSALLNAANVKESVQPLVRALHLTRINNGLNTPLQIPILEQLIGIYINAQQWQLADQCFLNQYRLRQLQYITNDPTVINHLQRYADWHRNMYLAGVDEL